MLKFFTRLEKTRNFVLLLFAFVMVGSLVFFYTPNPNTAIANYSQSEEPVAMVAGHAITLGELVRQKENYSQFSRGQTFPSKAILDGMIGSRIVRVEAEKLGLTASDAEVAARIRELNRSDDGKPFNQAIYEQNIIEQFGSISTYEQGIRDDLSARKVNAFVTSGVTVSEEELLDDYQRKNAKFDLTYVALNSAELAKKIEPTEAELQEYFEKNKAAYYISVPQKKIKYIFINTSKIGDKLSIPETDLRTEFDSLLEDKKIAGVLGQEIVLRISKPELDGQVLTKANELMQTLRKDGPIVTETAFADVAKGFSENPATARNGGKLSGPVRENLNKPDDPYQRLLKMSPGEITEPISYQGRYFILRRGDSVPKTFEAAKKEIEVSLRNRRAYSAAAELAQKVVDALKENKDIQKTASDFASSANMSVAEMIRETDFVKPGDEVPNIGVSPQFEEGIAPLEAVNDVGEKTPIQNGFAVPMLIDRKEPRDVEFSEVRAKIVDLVKLDKANAEIGEIAKQIGEGATTLAALASAARSKGFEAKAQKDFVLGSPLGEGPSAATSEVLENSIYALKAGEVTKNPIKVGDNWVIVGVSKREDADTAEFALQRTSLFDQMLAGKRGAVFSDYLAAARRRMEISGLIKIYDEAVKKADAQTDGF